MIRVVFLGTPDFAVPSLEALWQSSQTQLVGVVTQPDRPAGRGLHSTASPVKERALALDKSVPIYQPSRIRGSAGAVDFLRQTCPDLMVVVAFGQILPREFFAYPVLGTINVHASLLPRYRGAAPVIHAILNGDERTGVCIMKIDEGLDTGDVLACRQVEIGPQETAGALELRLAQQGADLLIKTIPPYASGQLQPVAQDHRAATFAPRVAKEQARLDWIDSAERLFNQIRAFNPRPGAFTFFRGGLVKIWSASLVEKGSAVLPPGSFESVGDVVRVVCGKGKLLQLDVIQPANRTRMNGREFSNGLALKPGDCFD